MHCSSAEVRLGLHLAPKPMLPPRIRCSTILSRPMNAHDEQDVRGVHAMNSCCGLAAAFERMLASCSMILSSACWTPRRTRRGDGRPVCLTGDLVDFVDVDDLCGPLQGRSRHLATGPECFPSSPTYPACQRGVSMANGTQDAASVLARSVLPLPEADKQDVALFELHTVVALEASA